MTFKEKLASYAFIGSVWLAGILPFAGVMYWLPRSVEYKTGTVGKESMEYGAYVLQIKTADGKYTASISPSGVGGRKTVESLATALKEGDSVRFVVQNALEDKFGNDKIGKLSADEIEVLSK